MPWSGRQVEANPLDEKFFSVVHAFKSATINAKISNEMKRTLTVEKKQSYQTIALKGMSLL